MREFGVGFDYQRAAEELPLVDQRDPVLLPVLRHPEREIRNGMQLYLTARVGYHFRVLDRLFLEPSVAAHLREAAASMIVSIARSATAPQSLYASPG